MTVDRFIPPYLPQKATYKPTHPKLFVIEFDESGDYSSCLRALRPFAKGEVLCPIENTLPGTKAYSSVQVKADPPLPGDVDDGEPRHIELNSDLLYVNHSCDPNVAFEVPADKSQWKVRALKDIQQGEFFTFAYFSTEWSMQQPFKCLCGSPKCIGTITGAREMDASILDTYFVNDHIKAMKKHQLAQK